MKLRPAAALLPHDLIAWGGGGMRRAEPLAGLLWFCSVHSDRRDAELMLRCQEARQRTFPVDMPPLKMIAGVGRVLECGGALWDSNPVWRHLDGTLRDVT